MDLYSFDTDPLRGLALCAARQKDSRSCLEALTRLCKLEKKKAVNPVLGGPAFEFIRSNRAWSMIAYQYKESRPSTRLPSRTHFQIATQQLRRRARARFSTTPE